MLVLGWSTEYKESSVLHSVNGPILNINERRTKERAIEILRIWFWRIWIAQELDLMKK